MGIVWRVCRLRVEYTVPCLKRHAERGTLTPLLLVEDAVPVQLQLQLSLLHLLQPARKNYNVSTLLPICMSQPQRALQYESNRAEDERMRHGWQACKGAVHHNMLKSDCHMKERHELRWRCPVILLQTLIDQSLFQEPKLPGHSLAEKKGLTRVLTCSSP